MTTQQRLGDPNPAPTRAQPDADPGIVVEDSKQDDGNRVTHTAVRATIQLGDELDLCADVAFYDDRVETDDVKATRRFANVVAAADGPVVIVPIWWLDTAKAVAEQIHTREERGVKWSNSTLQFLGSTVDRARHEGWRRIDFDCHLPEYFRPDDIGLAESTRGKWHLCRRGESACSHFEVSDTDQEFRSVNLADVIERLDLCQSARKRVGNLLDRHAGTSRAARYYQNDD